MGSGRITRVVRTFLWLAQVAAVHALPFKGRVRVGMGCAAHLPILLPDSPLKGEENNPSAAQRSVSAHTKDGRTNPQG
jgi:hypothetical protein